ncbi:MAG: hypothetical protein EXQ59_00245 [Acidobacteria bacterium]|nr:hypothetical protein [Acidobacteriota bacterium]
MPHPMPTVRPIVNEHQLLIFDLDGTLSDPTIGIRRSINHALAAFDYPAVDEQAISQCIGLPLDFAFRQIAPAASEDGRGNPATGPEERQLSAAITPRQADRCADAPRGATAAASTPQSRDRSSLMCPAAARRT